MTRWFARLAPAHAWALAEAWFMQRSLAPRRRRARPLDLAALSPHLRRDIGLDDATPPRNRPGAADGRMSRHR